MYKAGISVRNLVESILATGDIGGDMTLMSVERAQEGSRVHRIHQEMRQGENKAYEREVYLKHRFLLDEVEITVDGRADGILPHVYIEEIKSTYRNLEDLNEDYNELHWAQVKFYGYIYMEREGIEEIDLKLSYYRIDTDEFISFDRSYKREELREFTLSVLKLYKRLLMLNFKWQEARNKSIKALAFPFESYRQGQRKMAVNVYNTIRENRRILIQAPTGIGKTISTLFPSIIALREKKIDKIFYLTPKSTGKEIGENSIEILRAKGAKIRSLTLTSKEKICFMEEVKCEADFCPYAKGYYDRVIEGIIDILENEDSLNRSKIEEYARAHSLCPFEFSLDLSLYADLIIGDYNYAFDPRVYLKRFFDDKKLKHTFLVDEAHNLLDRARDMFSETILESSYLKVANDLRIEEATIASKAQGVANLLRDIKYRINDTKKERGLNLDIKIYEALVKFCGAVSEYLADEKKQRSREDFKKGFKEEYDFLLDCFFTSLSYIRIGDIYTEGHITYSIIEGEDLVHRIFCIDPSMSLSNCYGRADSIVFFSATLSPMDYYRKIYGLESYDYHMMLPSPFPRENLQVYYDLDINTRYKYRDKSYHKIKDNLKDMVDRKKGNYIAFFPSYKYMEEVYKVFKDEYGDDYYINIQERGQSERERQEVIDSFKELRDKSYLYFMVLGGVFSEGIDLKGDSLIGTAIIGLGYPTFDFERELIQDYFEENAHEGFNYAYTYPGLSKVTQAGGRVIRTEEDKGMIFLMDDRYKNPSIRRLLPDSWFPLRPKEEIIEDEDISYN